MFSTAQISGIARVLIAAVGGIAVNKGFASQEMIDKASDLTTITQVVGGVMMATSALWSVFRNSPVGILDSAGKIKTVTDIGVTDPKLVDDTKTHKVTMR